MRTLLLILLAACSATGQAQSAKPSRTILFVGAHPDDETAIGEVLTKYARLGNKVYVIIATDGQNGTRVTQIPAGDSLGKLRRLESACGCSILGLQPPIFFSIERLDTKIGTGNYFKAHKQFTDSLQVWIPKLNPDIIIAQGPDGDTHHSEHIVAGGAVTELLLAKGWVDKYPLYYFAWAKGDVGEDDLPYVETQYLNVRVDYTDEDEQKAIAAMKCFVTQFTEKEMQEEAERKQKDTGNRIFFRRFVTARGLKNDF